MKSTRRAHCLMLAQSTLPLPSEIFIRDQNARAYNLSDLVAKKIV